VDTRWIAPRVHILARSNQGSVLEKRGRQWRRRAVDNPEGGMAELLDPGWQRTGLRARSRHLGAPTQRKGGATAACDPSFSRLARPVSPDGLWLAVTSGELSGDQRQSQIDVYPYPAVDRREQVSTLNGSSASWRQDGRELYYVENASEDGPLKIRVMAVPITTTPTFSAGTPRVLFEGPFRIDGPFRGYDVTPDGQRFLMVREVQQPPARVSQMVLVQNWFEELKRLVPTN